MPQNALSSLTKAPSFDIPLHWAQDTMQRHHTHTHAHTRLPKFCIWLLVGMGEWCAYALGRLLWVIPQGSIPRSEYDTEHRSAFPR